jgi:hypothetical protein
MQSVTRLEQFSIEEVAIRDLDWALAGVMRKDR